MVCRLYHNNKRTNWTKQKCSGNSLTSRRKWRKPGVVWAESQGAVGDEAGNKGGFRPDSAPIRYVCFPVVHCWSPLLGWSWHLLTCILTQINLTNLSGHFCPRKHSPFINSTCWSLKQTMFFVSLCLFHILPHLKYLVLNLREEAAHIPEAGSSPARHNSWVTISDKWDEVLKHSVDLLGKKRSWLFLKNKVTEMWLLKVLFWGFWERREWKRLSRQDRSWDRK